jgi:hypothetical protein
MLLGFIGVAGDNSRSIFLAELSLVGSTPFIALASLICFVFAGSVASYPYGWALAGVLTTVVGGAAEAGISGAALSLVLSVPAAGLFLLFAKLLPFRVEAGRDKAMTTTEGSHSD